MSYRYSSFDSLSFTLYDVTEDIGMGRAQTNLTALPGGGMYDAQGAGQSPISGFNIVLRGTLVDTSLSGLLTQYKNLRAKLGVKGLLVRTEDSSGNTSSNISRLVRISTPRTVEYVTTLPVELEFSLLLPVWTGSAHSVTGSLSGGANVITCANNGNAPQTNINLKFTNSTGVSNTSIVIDHADLGFYTTYTGTLSTGGHYVNINNGGKWVVKDGTTDDFSHYALHATNHTIDEWFYLPASGSAYIRVTATTGLTYLFTYNDAWY